MGEYSYILEQQGKTTSEKLAAFTAAVGWRDELATYRIVQDEYEMRAAAAAEQGISLLDEPPYTAEELAALDAESAAYYDAFAANYVATAAFPGSGSGTQSDPYIITNRAELGAMADDLTAYYQLANDIDLGGSSSPWTPIGTDSAPFAGSLDGNGYTIANMNISGVLSNGVGFFGHINGADIQNIGIIGSTIISTTNWNGILVGNFAGSNPSVVSQVYTAGTISSSKSTHGGIVGSAGPSAEFTIQNCFSDVVVEGHGVAGGIFGGNSATNLNAAEINNCYAIGDITLHYTSSTNHGAGIAWLNGYVAVNNCVALMDVINGRYSTRVSKFYSGNLVNNYANAEMLVYGNTVSGGTTSNADGADVSASTYHTQAFWQNTLGWDFTNTWYWDSTANLPKLRAFLHGPTISSVSATPTTGGVDTEITLSATVQDATSYQWQYSANSGGTWQDIAGATSATATWTPGAVGTYQVRLQAANTYGTTKSYPVTVTIYPSPTISDVTIYPNPSDESATFLMSVTVNES